MSSGLFDLRGKTALITGSSKGIGKAIAFEMARHGAKVVISSRKADVCDEVAEAINRELEGEDGGAIAIAAHIGHKEELQRLVSETRQQFGQIDALVCNAGFGIFGSVEEVPLAAAQQQFDTNFFGVLRCLRAVLPQMRERGAGRIVLVASLAGRAPIPFQAHYSASKAAADHLVRAYFHTYGMPTLTTNCSNNYGPYQFPEKLIPVMILNALEGRPLPIYGNGQNVRDWIYVGDHCAGILDALQGGQPGEKYNLGGGNERTNIQVVDGICQILDEQLPPASNPRVSGRGLKSYSELKTFVDDRPGHDWRYAIDASKARAELKWQPQHDFESGLRETVRWYLQNLDWCSAVAGESRERLGLSKQA